MAKKSARFRKLKPMASIRDTEGGNFGGYEEENGGGTPKGGIWGGRDGRVGWDNRLKAGETGHREEQPRTSDGKFTYNSVNGKETIYDGRGKTVNPLLTGGKNGIKIDDVKAQFEAKSGNLYEQFKKQWHQEGGMKVVKEGKKKYHIKVAQADVWELAKYSFKIAGVDKDGNPLKDKDGKVLGEFGGKISHRKNPQTGEPLINIKKESEQWNETKKGAPGKAGELAKKEARKTGAEQYVKDIDTGAILKFKDANKGPEGMAKKLKKMVGSQLNHSEKDIKDARMLMAKAGYDVTQYTDEQIDQVMDEFLGR